MLDMVADFHILPCWPAEGLCWEELFFQKEKGQLRVRRMECIQLEFACQESVACRILSEKRLLQSVSSENMSFVLSLQASKPAWF
jgi:hypothetical protein